MYRLYKGKNKWVPGEREIASVMGNLGEIFSEEQQGNKTAWGISSSSSLIQTIGHKTNEGNIAVVVIGDMAAVPIRDITSVTISDTSPIQTMGRVTLAGNIAFEAIGGVSGVPIGRITSVTISGTSVVAINFTTPSSNATATKTDLIENKDVEAKDLIARISSNSQISCREQLANRLTELFSDSKEEDLDSIGINVGSFRSFYSFLQSFPKLKCPEIALTSENYIYISWRIEPNQIFSAHFLPNDEIRFVIFKPNDLHPDRPIRIYGTTTRDMLMETVSPHGVDDWIESDQ